MLMQEPGGWRIAGTPQKRLDTPDKLSGKTVYGVDVRRPGMLMAAIKQAPVFGATVADYDAAAVREMPGVRHILKVDDNAVAVVADGWWQANRAVEAMPVTWTEPPAGKVTSASIAEHLKEGLDQREAFIGLTHGDALKAIAGSAKRLEAVYAMPFVAHAPLEPPCCTARWTRSRVEVWATTQNAESAHKAAAEAAGLPLSAAELHRPAVGGSFGRRIRHDVIRQAVIIARQIPDTPIKLMWSREEDMARSFYRPITQTKLVGGIDEKGDLAGLIVRISGQSIVGSQAGQTLPSGRDARMFQGLFAEAGEAQIGYSVPNVYIDHAMRNTHVPVGSWRGVHSNQNAFMLEVFLDELARLAERDPLDFRRAMMKSHPRHLATLTAAAEKSQWGSTPPAGRFRGIAQCQGYGTCTAAVAEISLDDDVVRVHRITFAIDSGQVANPDLVAAQVEGSVAFALSALFHQEITIRSGAVVERNFDTFGVLQMSEMPQVETVLLPSGEGWGGVGSAAVAVVAPAVVNAIHAATPKRVRSLPIKSGRLT
jgi:isoquinoline 1-oxidoreductase beta subunit